MSPVNRSLKFLLVPMALAGALLVSQCGGEKQAFPQPSPDAKDGSFVSTPGTFKAGGRTYAADFGIITVPENRKAAGSRLIHLPVIRVRAAAQEPVEPVFCLAGGPGQSNMSWAIPETLLARHDVVMVGYRGVDGSCVLDCPEVVEAMKSGGDPLAEESFRKVAGAWEASSRRFQEQGIDWNGYTIEQTIEDMEAVRGKFRYPRIDLLSESYGTRIAYFYGLMHEKSIFRSVMVAVNPPGHFIWDPAVVDEQIREYSRLWAQDSSMAARCPDLAGAMQRVLNSLPRTWCFIPISPGKVRITTFSLLYHRNTAAMAFDAFVAADNGDYSGLALMSLAFDYMLPSMIVWGDLASKGATADFDSTRDYREPVKMPQRILGSPMNSLWAYFSYARLPLRLMPAEYRVARTSLVETLMLSGDLDFSTPPAAATRELLPYLPRGRQIILSHFGHVGDLRYLRRNSTDRMIVSYFETGVPDPPDIALVPMDFQVNWGLPVIAKASLGVLSLLAIALISALVWIARRIRSRFRHSPVEIRPQ